jgi:hypothetical protein
MSGVCNQDNYPEMSTVALDLSPFYLAEARANLMHWKSVRANDRDFGGVEGTGVQIVMAPAEKVGNGIDTEYLQAD